MAFFPAGTRPKFGLLKTFKTCLGVQILFDVHRGPVGSSYLLFDNQYNRPLKAGIRCLSRHGERGGGWEFGDRKVRSVLKEPLADAS